MNESAPPAEAPTEAAAEENASSGARSTAAGRWLRTISVVAVIAIVLVGILYANGSQPITYHADVKIQAPPQVIFPYLSEPNLVVKWMADVAEIQPTNDIEHKNGAKAAIVIERNGEQFTMDSEVLVEVPDKEIRVRLTSDMFTIVSDYLLVPKGEQTNVSIDMTANYKGFACITAPLIGGAIQEKLESDFHRLREEVEGGSISK